MSYVFIFQSMEFPPYAYLCFQKINTLSATIKTHNAHKI